MLTRREFVGMLGTAGAMAAAESAGLQTPPVRAAAPSNGGPALPAPDRAATLARHAPRVKSPDQNAVLSLGNGRFAFNVDCTGLQTLHAEYKVIPLSTLSHWGWHSVPMPADMDPAKFRYQMYPYHGRQVGYNTSATGQQALFDYLRANPHRLHLGRIAFVLDGKPIAAAQLSDIDQHLDLYTGIITSKFSLAGQTVEVVTCCHSDFDGVGIRITSPLLNGNGPKLALQFSFPYGSTQSSSDGGDWTRPDAHTSVTFTDPRAPDQITVNRTLDATRYGVRVGWLKSPGGVDFKETAPHTFLLAATPAGPKNTLDISVGFDPEPNRATPLFSIDEAVAASAAAWNDYWNHGAAIDMSGSTDPRAPELERRVVLSQYLTAIHCSGQYPSQETGLLCNSWFGKFHLEMHWWHSVHFTIWNRHKYFGRTMFLYYKILDSSRARAKRQGFAGARWPKMLGPDGEDSPSTVGPLLIWQQPHPIYYAELSYRNDPTRDTLLRWRNIVLESAEFMASYAQFDDARKMYVLGPSIKTVSENNPTETTLNPTWELTAWRFGLRTAQSWLERLGQPRNAQWDKVLSQLAPAPTKDGVYQMQEDMDTYSKQWAYEHPALLGALGVLPGDNIDPATMAASVKKVRETWDFARVWGWDFPTAALCAARTGQPELAIDFLTMEAPMNRYLANGCNFQRDNVPAYFPGNGGLLSAIGMMAGGWTAGPKTPLPGFPKNSQWNIRAEGFGTWI